MLLAATGGGDFYTLAVIVTLGIFTSVTAPLLLARRLDREHRRDRREDWARQDAVAARTEAVAEHLKTSNDLAAANAADIKTQLNIIRADVNSNLTAQIQATRDAIAGQHATMVRLIKDPTPKEQDVIDHLASALAELDTILAERLKPPPL